MLPASTRSLRWLIVGMVVLLIIAPFVAYPIFLIKALCFALFACAFNLLLGYAGLLSFGHALFFGGAGYIAGHAALVWGMPFEISLLIGTWARRCSGWRWAGWPSGGRASTSR